MNSNDRLVLKTKESLYKPIEIEIDEKVYLSIKTTNAVLVELNKLDEKVAKEDSIDPVYAVIRFLFNVDLEILERLDKREVQDIYTFTKRKFLEIEKERAELIKRTFREISGAEKEKVKEIVPNEKRSGNK
ncbi:hypothetical protein MUO71_04825 [Candidatus Bathyarchaeota archaeon]|nr:hypothetical protein [Candidatus Bathyarchaeota archaeon]